MEDKTVITLTNYISVWGWMIISMVFLMGTFILFALPKSNLTIVFGTAFFLIFGITQFVSTKRRKELIEQNEQTR